MIGNFKEVTEAFRSRFADSPLGRQLEEVNFDKFSDADDSTLDAYVIETPPELCDDNDKPCKIEGSGWIPNISFILDDVAYKTDDKGDIYCVDGKLQPNTTYELNGNIYTTDEKGRIIRCEAKPVKSPENPRDNDAQRQAGGADRKPNDQGGHIVGRDMNGDSGIGNLVAMDSKINQSDFKRMENDIKAALDEGQSVTTKTEISYSDNSERPDEITVIITADEKDTVYPGESGAQRNQPYSGTVGEIFTGGQKVIGPAERAAEPKEARA